MRILILNAVTPQPEWDFGRTLAKGLLARNSDARIAVLAHHSLVDDARINARPVIDRLPLVFEDGSIRSVSVFVSLIEGVFHYLVCNEEDTRSPSDKQDGEWCALLVRGVLGGLKAIVPSWSPDIVHINDACPGLAAVYLHALCVREWDMGGAFVTTVHSVKDSGATNTLVTGSGLGDDVRVVRCYKSPSKLASTYEAIYRDVLAGGKNQFLAA